MGKLYLDQSRSVLHGMVNNMGCRNCGDKSSQRHAPTVVVSGDVDSGRQLVEQPAIRTAKAFTPDPDEPLPMPPSPHQAFIEAKTLTYEDISRRNDEQLRRAGMEVESMYLEMTDAMRQFHVMSLLAVANYENMAMPGVTPDQAIVALKSALDRDDFNNINGMYPTLKAKVNIRCQELMDKKIVL